MRHPFRSLPIVLTLAIVSVVVGCRSTAPKQSASGTETPAAAIADPHTMRIEIENDSAYADGWQVVELDALKELARQRGVTSAHITTRNRFAYLPKAIEVQRALQEAGVKEVTIGHGRSHPE